MGIFDTPVHYAKKSDCDFFLLRLIDKDFIIGITTNNYKQKPLENVFSKYSYENNYFQYSSATTGMDTGYLAIDFLSQRTLMYL